MEGMCNRILQFCDYMLEVVEQSRDAEHAAEGTKCGVGLRFSEIVIGESSIVCVESVTEGSPAYYCGRIKKGDILVLIDTMTVQGQTLQTVYSSVAGPAGSVVRLGFLAADSDYIEVKLERSKSFHMNGGILQPPSSILELFGVGIVFQETFVEGVSRIHVHSWRDASPASGTGRIREGDVLVMVNGEEVKCAHARPRAQARPLINASAPSHPLSPLPPPSPLPPSDTHAVRHPSESVPVPCPVALARPLRSQQGAGAGPARSSESKPV